MVQIHFKQRNLFGKFTSFYCILNVGSITVKASHWTLSCACGFQPIFTSFHRRTILMLSSIFISPKKGLLFSDFLAKVLYQFLISSHEYDMSHQSCSYRFRVHIYIQRRVQIMKPHFLQLLITSSLWKYSPQHIVFKHPQYKTLHIKNLPVF